MFPNYVNNTKIYLTFFIFGFFCCSHVHTRLRTHGESVAFFGGDSRELAITSERFDALLNHENKLVSESVALRCVCVCVCVCVFIEINLKDIP